MRSVKWIITQRADGFKLLSWSRTMISLDTFAPSSKRNNKNKSRLKVLVLKYSLWIFYCTFDYVIFLPWKLPLQLDLFHFYLPICVILKFIIFTEIFSSSFSNVLCYLIINTLPMNTFLIKNWIIPPRLSQNLTQELHTNVPPLWNEMNMCPVSSNLQGLIIRDNWTLWDTFLFYCFVLGTPGNAQTLLLALYHISLLAVLGIQARLFILRQEPYQPSVLAFHNYESFLCTWVPRTNSFY